MGISPGDFEKLKQRMGGRKKSDSKGNLEVRVQFGRLLGIDPSLRGTGFGVIEVVGRECRFLASGTLHCPSAWPRSRCLAQIASSIREVIQKYAPEGCAVEGLFFAQNLRTAITLGEARGAALAVVAEAALPIYELAPRQVKQAIVGFGGAQKLAVAKMVQRMLNLEELPDPDAADALALALALVQTGSSRSGIRLKPL